MFNLADMTKMNQEVFNAMTASSSVATKGMQQLATEATEYTKKSYEDGAAVAEKLAGAKSFDKAFEIQTEYAKSAYESFVAQSTKVGELCTTIAKDAYAPFEAATAKVKA